MHNTRDAAPCRQAVIRDILACEVTFVAGRATPCNLFHPMRPLRRREGPHPTDILAKTVCGQSISGEIGHSGILGHEWPGSFGRYYDGLSLEVLDR